MLNFKESSVSHVRSHGYRHWTVDDDEFLRNNYYRGKRDEIINVLNRSWDTIMVRAEHMGLVRDLSFTKRKYFVDDDFFKTWSPDMAWCLGLMASDGSVGSDFDVVTDDVICKDVCISSTDLDIIEKFAGCIKSTYHIGITKRPGCKNKYYLSLRNSTMYDDLVRLGIIERKSLVVDFPLNYPDEFMRDYIRGEFDGDGHIKFVSSHCGGYMYLHIDSGSRRFIYGMRDFIFSRLIADCNIVESPRGDSTYYRLNFNTDDSMKFCQYIYHDNMGDAYLDRKYNVWLECKRRKGI